jgi:hypothetical protein
MTTNRGSSMSLKIYPFRTVEYSKTSDWEQGRMDIGFQRLRSLGGKVKGGCGVIHRQIPGYTRTSIRLKTYLFKDLN